MNDLVEFVGGGSPLLATDELNYCAAITYGNSRLTEKLSQQLAYGMQAHQCATAWQKAMGEALFDTVLAKLRKSGIPKGPLVGSLTFFVSCSWTVRGASKPVSPPTNRGRARIQSVVDAVSSLG